MQNIYQPADREDAPSYWVPAGHESVEGILSLNDDAVRQALGNLLHFASVVAGASDAKRTRSNPRRPEAEHAPFLFQERMRDITADMPDDLAHDVYQKAADLVVVQVVNGRRMMRGLGEKLAPYPTVSATVKTELRTPACTSVVNDTVLALMGL